MEVCFGL